VSGAWSLRRFPSVRPSGSWTSTRHVLAHVTGSTRSWSRGVVNFLSLVHSPDVAPLVDVVSFPRRRSVQVRVATSTSVLRRRNDCRQFVIVVSSSCGTAVTLHRPSITVLLSSRLPQVLTYSTACFHSMLSESLCSMLYRPP